MKKRLFLLLPLFAMTMTGCDFNSIRDLLPWVKDVPTTPGEDDDHDEEDDGPISVTGVSLDKKTLSLNEGESSTLSYTVSPANATNKNVKWSTEDPLIATVENGLVRAWKEGSTTITVTTLDKSKTDTCTVTVSKPQPVQKEIENKFNFNEQGYTASTIDIDGQTIAISENFNVVFNKANGATKPQIYSYSEEVKGEKYSARAYAKNTITISSVTIEITKISMSFSKKKDGTNLITPNVGTFTETEWNGKSKSVTFTIGGDSGFRAIQQFVVSYKGQGDDDPDVVINLGEMSVAEVKTYIAEHPVKKNAFGNGVNENRYVTIKGFALAKIDLVKTTTAFGLDVSKRGKVIIGDNTGVIGCASENSSQGTCLWGKIGDYVCKDTSKYIVTGYISEYLGNPEILVTSFAWDSSLNISIDYSNFASEISTLSDLYESATAINYNCAGHGYGDVVSLKNLYCFNRETDGSGIRYFNMTDGINNIRILCYNIGDYSVGSYYDVTGIVSLKDYSCAIYAFSVKVSTETPFTFDFESVCTDITITDLRKIKGSQDDTATRHPDLVKNFGKFYKTTGYLRFVEEGGNLYIGISDTYSKAFVTGKIKALSSGIALIRNDDVFWNINILEDFKTLEYISESNFYFKEEKVTVYFVPRAISYEDGVVGWTIYAIPESIEAMLNPIEE